MYVYRLSCGVNEFTVAGKVKTTSNGVIVITALRPRRKNILAMESYVHGDVFKIKTFHLEGLKNEVSSAELCLY